MKKIVFLFFAFIFVALNAFADTITLKSGRQIEGDILERNNEAVKIDFHGAELTYFLDEIEAINGEKVAPVEAYQETIPAKEPAPGLGVESPKAGALPAPTAFKSEPQARSNPYKDSHRLGTAVSAAAVGMVFVAMFILFILLYIYSCLCLHFIAQKTNHQPVWLAWIPIANLFLMCKIAALSYWWLLIILTCFIPLVGVLANAAFFVYLWYKIALARNKPGWLGILTILPIANLVIMGYLAFSD